jgi:hypothetical protein
VNLCKHCRGVRPNARTEQAEGAERPTTPKRQDQKVGGQEQVVMRHLSQTERPRCSGKPVALPTGRRTVRDADRAAGKGRWRKRRPLCNGADRGCASHTGNITPRESGQTSTRSLVTRNLMETQKQEFVEQGAAARTAGASLRTPVDWHAVNWRKAHRNVRRLQARIVKAMKANCHRQIHSRGWNVSKPRPVKRAFGEA